MSDSMYGQFEHIVTTWVANKHELRDMFSWLNSNVSQCATGWDFEPSFETKFNKHRTDFGFSDSSNALMFALRWSEKTG